MAAGREEYKKYLALKEEFTLVSVDQSAVEEKLTELDKLFQAMHKLISTASLQTPKAPLSMKELDALIAEDKRKLEHKEPSHNIHDMQILIVAKFEKMRQIRGELIVFQGMLKLANKDDIDTMMDLIKSINKNLQVFNRFLPDPFEDSEFITSPIITKETKQISEPLKQSAVALPRNKSGLSIALKPELKSLSDQTNVIPDSYEDFKTLAQIAMQGIDKDKTKLIDYLKSELTTAINKGYHKIMAGRGAAAYVELYERVSQLCNDEVARTIGCKMTDVNPAYESLRSALLVQARNYKLYGGLEEDLKKGRRFDA